MNTLAAIRPDSQSLPLLLHVGGAMILVGGMLTASSALAFARGNARLLRFGYWTLVLVALPGVVLMRVGAEWISERQGWDDVPDELVPDWLWVGVAVGDVGTLVFLVTLVVGGVGVYRLRSGKGSVLLKTTMALSIVLLTAYVVAVWAMSAKPG
ncbi:MAG TPA: hypothetical protein VK926_04325, partial [Gaiellaceae bacterium]|nr:hypothetical protein [Gaiellaceae bacterium]